MTVEPPNKGQVGTSRSTKVQEWIGEAETLFIYHLEQVYRILPLCSSSIYGPQSYVALKDQCVSI